LNQSFYFKNLSKIIPLNQNQINISEDARQSYIEEAERLRILHQKEYPDYKYKPRKKPKSSLTTTAGSTPPHAGGSPISDRHAPQQQQQHTPVLTNKQTLSTSPGISNHSVGLSEQSKVISKTKIGVNHNNNVMMAALKESGNRLAIPQKVRDSARIKLKLMQQQQQQNSAEISAQPQQQQTTADSAQHGQLNGLKFKLQQPNNRQQLLQQQHNPETIVVHTTTQGKL
jgi:hypothetical protein